MADSTHKGIEYHERRVCTVAVCPVFLDKDGSVSFRAPWTNSDWWIFYAAVGGGGWFYCGFMYASSVAVHPEAPHPHPLGIGGALPVLRDLVGENVTGYEQPNRIVFWKPKEQS